MARSVFGIVVGAIAWTVGFWILALLLARLWPDYAMQGRHWMKEGLFTLTPAMACCNLLLWVLAEIGAGWTAARSAPRREAAWVLAGLVGLYLAIVHLVFGWPRFPWWYNLGVVIPAVPAVLWGARLARSPHSASR